MSKVTYNRQPIDFNKPLVNTKNEQMEKGSNRVVTKILLKPDDKRYIQVLAKQKGVSVSKFINDIVVKELRVIMKKEAGKKIKF